MAGQRLQSQRDRLRQQAVIRIQKHNKSPGNRTKSGVAGGGEAASIDPDWGEPGLTAAEKIYGWNSFIVLAMVSGRPENPVNAVAPDARAHCQIRYTVDSDPATFEASLRKHLDENGFKDVAIENAGIRMPASRTDPHHPWDPPESELGRVDPRDVPLPAGYPADRAEREAILDAKPRHWRMWYEGTFVSNYEAPAKWVPKTLTADNVREINAMAHIENELIDEAIGRVLASISSRCWGDDLDVLFTTDHGELQGDFGLLFKGPYHVDGLMRLPLIWRPAKSAGVAPAVVNAPVSHLSLAATFLEADIRDGIDASGATTVFHLAAQAGVRKSWGRDFHVYTVNNVEATQILLEACVQHPIERLVYASSSSVYGDDVTLPMREDARPQPVSPYGVTKLSAEQFQRMTNWPHRTSEHARDAAMVVWGM